MQPVFHILSRQTFEEANAAGVYRPPSLANQGFIHLSYKDQVCRVADALYSGQGDLVLLELDPLTLRTVDEDLTGSGEAFPHLYDELDLDAVVEVHAFPCSADGTFSLPASLML